ncbi:MAG: acetate kinase [Herminiimonas sp.]|nr:acetate kinase [Herminiimonas sp.]
MTAGRSILTINTGSSSLKFALFGNRKGEIRRLVYGQIEPMLEAPHLLAHSDDGQIIHEFCWDKNAKPRFEELLDDLLRWIIDLPDSAELAAVGHRVVHGGMTFKQPVVVDDGIIEKLDKLVSLAPLHEPHNIAAIKAIRKIRPDLPQIASFDTAFHEGHDPVVDHYGLPDVWAAQGIRKYGFHGLSYEYIASVLSEKFPNVAKRRVIVAHLGNGASLCAMKDGQSIDSTMGFTTLDGLLMGTRCGSIDPGVILHLQKEKGMTITEVERLLYHESGLLGVSGISSDVRNLLSSRDPRAALAIDLFVHRLVGKTGELMMQMKGLDALVFTGGIGEHQPIIRKKVCEHLDWLGLSIDETGNEQNRACIHDKLSKIQVLVIPTNEELMIARHTFHLMEKQKSQT